MPFRLFGLLSTLLILATPGPAQAVEVWTMLETRVAIAEGHPALPEEWRFFSQYRYGSNYAFFGQALLRTGPIWNMTDWFTLATHLTTALAQEDPGVYEQELRAELEGTFRKELGALTISDRSRFEHSWFPDGTRWRYRNQLRAAYTPEAWPWKPYASEELFYVFGRGPTENRVQLGVSHNYFPQGRTDVGYMFRSQNESTGWQHSHLATLTLFFGPRNQPFVRGPGAD